MVQEESLKLSFQPVLPTASRYHRHHLVVFSENTAFVPCCKALPTLIAYPGRSLSWFSEWCLRYFVAYLRHAGFFARLVMCLGRYYVFTQPDVDILVIDYGAMLCRQPLEW